MCKENKNAIENIPDINKFYTVMEGYIEYCIQNPKVKLTDKDKEGLSDIEILEKEDELKSILQKHKKQNKNFQKTYESMYYLIAEGRISVLKTYVDALKKLYDEKSDWKRDIKNVLVSSKSLKLFRDARKNIIDLYPILLTVNNTFPVDDYAVLSLSPKSAIYGSEVDKTQKGSTKIAPFKNDKIQEMLELFLQVKDYKRFRDWIMEILLFDSNQLVDNFKEEFIPIREELKAWIYNQINTKEEYKSTITEALFKNKLLNKLFDAFVDIPIIKERQGELERKIKQAEEDVEKEKMIHEEHRWKQSELIKERNAEIALLNENLKDFEKCKQQLTSYIERYQAQLSMNERITIENERRLREMETDYDHMQDELSETIAELGELKTSHEALLSDFSLKNNELMRLKELASQKEETARIDVMRELVTGINEQFFYLTMFYLELRDTGKLESESIELYADTLSNIDSVLNELGIKKIGVINQKVSYDATIHIASDAKIGNGESVIVSGYGWKIGDDVYIKVPVEKGE